MKIIVCVKQVIDPEAPPSSFSIDAATRTAQMRGANPVIDPFGEYAVEAALKLKDTAGAEVIVLSLGAGLQRDVVKKPLAMGADGLILLENAAFAGLNAAGTVAALAAAVRKIDGFDLVLCGREASDTNAGLTGPGLAEALGLPCVTLAGKIEVDGTIARIQRVTSSGYDVVEVGLPAVVTVSNEVGEARYPTIKGIMGARKITPEVWSPADIGFAAPAGMALKDLYQPVFEGTCEFIAGETGGETGTLLADKLRHEKII
jgi:electron transfer flavoprotein beta subunit